MIELGRREFIIGGVLAGGALIAGCESGEKPEEESTAPPVSIPPETPQPGLPANLKDTLGFAVSVDTLLGLSEQEMYQRFGLATRLGAEGIRVDFDGSLGNDGDPGHYDWSTTDKIMAAATRRGLGVTALLSYTAEQQRIAPDQAIYPDRPRPKDIGMFAEFAGAAVLRYRGQGLKKTEIWNEPNISPDGADPESYVALFRATAAQVREANPHALVSIGGLAPSDTTGNAMSPPDFMAGLYAAGLRGTEFDAVAMHPYCYPATPDQYESWSTFSRLEATSPSLYSVLAAHGDSGKPIWITEFGAPTIGTGIEATPQNEHLNTFNAANGYVSLKLQAESLSQMYTYRFRRANVTDRFGFTLIDVPNIQGTQNGFGVYYANGQPKLAAAAVQKAILGYSNIHSSVSTTPSPSTSSPAW